MSFRGSVRTAVGIPQTERKPIFFRSVWGIAIPAFGLVRNDRLFNSPFFDVVFFRYRQKPGTEVGSYFPQISFR